MLGKVNTKATIMENQKSLDLNSTLNLRAFALATLVPVVMMIVAMWLKPLWRDEYFSQFFADPNESLSFLLVDRWAPDPHPPAYNPLLWVWSHFSVHPFWQKCLSFLILGLGALAAVKLTAPDHKRRLFVFFLVCLGSYWLIYFATEIRPYVMNFTLSALLTLGAVRILETDKPGPGVYLFWLLVGIVLSLTHYFGALWFACLGFVIGLTRLTRGDKTEFVKIGLLSVIGMIPILLWANYSYAQMDFTAIANDAPLGERFVAGAKQFLRGLLVKTFGSNPLITFLSLGTLGAALTGQHRTDSALIRAVILTVVLAFVLHLFFVNMIKERAFIVIMPALLWVMAGAISATQHKWARFIPLVTVVMPFLFIPEYFKNKEEIPELLAAMEPYQTFCADQPLAVYYRPALPKDLYPWTSEKLFGNFARELVDLRTATHLTKSPCPVLAVSVLLPKNDKDMIEEATGYILKAGYRLEDIEFQKFGKGRSLLWLKAADGS